MNINEVAHCTRCGAPLKQVSRYDDCPCWGDDKKSEIERARVEGVKEGKRQIIKALEPYADVGYADHLVSIGMDKEVWDALLKELVGE